MMTNVYALNSFVSIKLFNFSNFPKTEVYFNKIVER